jgi:glycosyltransferase involved in cell wall biosynthesis
MLAPTLTALMPVKAYHERYLHEAVGSMLAQASPRWRALVIAEEPVSEELKAIVARDPRFEVIVNEGRKLAGALNTGMRRAETEFVATLLGDDMWSPGTVEVVARSIAESPRTDFFHSARRVVDEQGRRISSVHPSRARVSVEDFGTGTSPVKHLLCWRREMGLAIGGMDESLDSVAVDDYDFPWSMAENGARFTAIPDCLYVYRDHRESFRLTTHLPRSHHKRELARIMRKHGADRATIRHAVSRAERAYLKQCLFRSPLDRWLKTRRGHDPRRGWRETYE